MKKTLSFISVCLLLATTAFADRGQKSESHDQRSLSFDDIRSACLNPSKFHNQVAPTNIQVSCRDVQQKWVPDSDGTYTMGNDRQIAVSVMSDKYSSHTVSGRVPSTAQVASCPRLREVSETVESIRAVSCDELVAFTGSAIDFCTSSINSLRSINPESVNLTDTGKTADFCGYGNGQRGQK